MRKIGLSIIFSLIFIPSIFSQSRWIDLHSLPQLSPTDRYEDIYFLNAKTGYAIHIEGKIYKTTDGGRTFNLAASQQGVFFRSVGFFTESTGIIGTLNDSLSLLRTTNGGTNWAHVTNVNGVSPTGICGISVVDSTTAYAVGRYTMPAYFLKTTDKGASWTSYTIPTTQIKSIVDCYFWSQDSGIVIGGIAGGNNFSVGTSVVLFTQDGGKSFLTVYRTTRASEWGWKISFPNKNTGFVSVESLNKAVVLKTTNRGINWTDMVFTATNDLEGIGFINENTGWIGGWDGPTYVTTNSGANWSQAPWGNYLNRFRFINDTLGYAVGNSIYKFTQEPVGISQNSTEIPKRINLYQNYPNPFNPSTVINYEIRFSGLVTLKIFDVKGNEVQTLVSDIQRAGIYSINFDGADLPSGIYYYKLVSEDFSQTKKMTLIK